MNAGAEHRLDGLEPDNLLAFMALLGLLRVLEEARPNWRPRVSWTVEDPPLRPALRVPESAGQEAVAEAAADGLGRLARRHDFSGLKDLKMPSDQARSELRGAARVVHDDRYAAEMWAAFLSDVVIDEKGITKPTPLCFLGAGRTRFLENFEIVPKCRTPPRRGKGRDRQEVSEVDCLTEALFSSWRRPDPSKSFRWDPNEDSRHAYRWAAPTDQKEMTQHGANRLAAVGLSALTVVPVAEARGPQLQVLGGIRAPSGFSIRWPIWRDSISLAGIRGLLGHPDLGRLETREALGVVEVRCARRVSHGRYPSISRAFPEERE